MLEALKRIIARLSGGRLFPYSDPRWKGLDYKKGLAARGEEMAGRKLRRDGYSILARNWRWHRYELDLIARKGDLVAVVEVKTRRDDRFGAPQEAVPAQGKTRGLPASFRCHRRHRRREGRNRVESYRECVHAIAEDSMNRFSVLAFRFDGALTCRCRYGAMLKGDTD